MVTNYLTYFNYKSCLDYFILYIFNCKTSNSKLNEITKVTYVIIWILIWIARL